MRAGFLAFVLILTFSMCAAGQTTGGKNKLKVNGEDEERIGKVLADFVDAWNKHDANAFSMVFAEDADFTNVAGVSAHGRTEVEKFHEPRFATTFKDTHLKITKTKIRVIKSGVAAVDSWWEMTGAKNREGQELPLRKGLLNFVMAKEGKMWFITIMHNMNLPDSP